VGLTVDLNGAGSALRDPTAELDIDTFAVHSQRNQLAALESLQIPDMSLTLSRRWEWLRKVKRRALDAA
jgi:hypothetical protein